MMIYFDNAATTNKKPDSVTKAVKRCIDKYSANPGRSAHRLSMMASETVYETRERVARFLSTDHPERVVFTYNTTYALNIAIKSLIKPSSHVLISNLEHNSVLRPVHKLAEAIGVEYTVFDALTDDLAEEIERHIRPETRAIVCTLASNVTGRRIPMEILSQIKKRHGLILIVDAAQAAGHEKIDLGTNMFDAICFPAHKAMLGIMGCGVCVFGDESATSIIEGGSGTSSKSLYMPSQLPEAVEAGTLGLPSIVALNEGIKYLEKYGHNEVKRKLDSLTEMLVERILNLKGARLISGENGVVSFLLRDLGSEETARMLDKHGICTRAGLHCAPLAHRALGTLDSGVVRASLSIFNTKKEIDTFYKVLTRI